MLRHCAGSAFRVYRCFLQFIVAGHVNCNYINIIHTRIHFPSNKALPQIKSNFYLIRGIAVRVELTPSARRQAIFTNESSSIILGWKRIARINYTRVVCRIVCYTILMPIAYTRRIHLYELLNDRGWKI